MSEQAIILLAYIAGIIPATILCARVFEGDTTFDWQSGFIIEFDSLDAAVMGLTWPLMAIAVIAMMPIAVLSRLADKASRAERR